MNQLLIVYHETVEGEPQMGAEFSDVKQVPVNEVEPWERGTGPAGNSG